MSSNEMDKRMEKMRQAIVNEANDKVNQIRADAEEKFKVEKSSYFQREKDKVIDEYKRKAEDYEVQQRIQRSARVAEQKLAKMSTRHDLVMRLKNDVEHKIKERINDPNTYKALLKDLIVQGLIKLMEKNVELQCLTRDLPIVESIKAACEQEFTEVIKRECNVDFKSTITINKNHYLEEENPKCFGGVILSCLDGKIKCINTLNSRVDLLFQEFLPDIRKGLFPDLK